ncbi:PREDICTED: uncharacterized protein LOC108763326 [Trachymyrmex cornetzi]|uniref:uncharacterized protein LOC108763326 n=1 Tax=Trachymyrmex cornetzi TaxID=471704 RepID=UPI00084F4863|nr:PREDICTED: uncharacterized protein LOC108763326 [Trachymyrmex cornetzi]
MDRMEQNEGWTSTKDATTVASLVDPIVGRHVPYRLENGDLIIENNILLLIDQFDNSVCACQATPNNLILLEILPMSTLSDSSALSTTSESLTISMPTTSKSLTASMSVTSKSTTLMPTFKSKPQE